MFNANKGRIDELLTENNNLHFNVSVEIERIPVGRVTVKVDDVDFNFSNPGVWCYTPKLDSPEMTTWDKYTVDVPVL